MGHDKTEEERLVDEFLTRGIENVYPDRESLRRRLLSGEKLSVYFGIDPTGKTLHLGYAVHLLKLRLLQDLGHNIIILYGGFTAQIGDPTDKKAPRQPLSAAEVRDNAAQYKKQIGKILDLEKTNVSFLDNEKWTNKLKPRDLLDLLAHFTVSQLLERDMFQERLKKGKEIHAHELLYPVFQAYDAVTMGVDMQLGGNDQTFNMLAGRTLMRRLKDKEMFVVAAKLLVDPSGRKMGKTEGNTVSLDDDAEEMFGKIMSWPDSLILPAFELCTNTALAEIGSIKESLANGLNPRAVKERLAETIAAMYHGPAEAALAKKNFAAVFSKKSPPERVKEIKAAAGATIIDCLSPEAGSRTQLRQLIAAGAVENVETGEKISDPFYKPAENVTVRIGKHRFLKIRVR